MCFIAPMCRWICGAILCVALMPAVRVSAQGRIAQTLDAFYSPSAAAFSADGRTLYVANAARTDYGMLAGRGAISRVEVGADGQLTVTEAKFVEGLNAPLGLVVLPAQSGPFPAGSLAVSIGGRWTMKDRQTSVTDARERGTGLVFFDPKSGTRLGAVYLGEGSAVKDVLGHIMTDPGAVAADAEGNLFISEVVGVGLDVENTERARAGIIRLTPAAVATLARDEAPPAGSVSFLNVPEVPAGLAWYDNDRRLYWVTGPGYGDMAGAILYLEGGTFGPGGKIETAAKNQAAMVGACVTPRGSLLAVQSEGSIVALKRGRGKARGIRFPDRGTVFLSPGQPAAINLENGRVLVVLPEMASGGRPAWRHRLQAFTLPDDY